MGVLGRAGRDGACRLCRARRGRSPTTSRSRRRSRRASARSRARFDWQRAAARRRHRPRVPDGRADLARAGAPRRRGRPRPPRRGRDPARAVRGGDRRADRARLGHRGLLPERRSATGRGGRRARARPRRARSARRLPGDRHLPDRRRRARRRLPRRRRAQVPARLGGARLPLVPAAGSPAAAAHADRLVRRPRHLRDGRPRLLAVADARRFESGTPPIPAIYAGIAGIELIREIGIAATREHVTALNERLIAGIDELGGSVVTPRDARASRSRSSASARPTRPASSRCARRGRHRHLGARRQPPDLPARLQRRRGHRRAAGRTRPPPRLLARG